MKKIERLIAELEALRDQYNTTAAKRHMQVAIDAAREIWRVPSPDELDWRLIHTDDHNMEYTDVPAIVETYKNSAGHYKFMIKRGRGLDLRAEEKVLQAVENSPLAEAGAKPTPKTGDFSAWIQEVISSYEKAIDAQKLAGGSDRIVPHMTAKLYAYQRAFQVWSQQPQPAPFPWIPVKERNPEKPGWYEVTFNREKPDRTVGFAEFGSRWDVAGVIAWRELPEPYKE